MRSTGLLLLLLSGCTDRALSAATPPLPAHDLGATDHDLATGGTLSTTTDAPPDLAPSGHADLAPADLAPPPADLAPPPADLPPSTRTWSLYSGPGPWSSLINSAAIDSHETLYVSDGDNIYTVRNGTASIYLSQATIAATGTIQSLDLAPDDTLYFLAGTSIYHSTAPNQLTLQHQVTAAPVVLWLGVVDSDQLLVLDYYLDGMEKIAGTTETLLYGPTIQGATDCSSQSLATQRDGVFFYLPGCNGSPLIKGTSDGTAVSVLLQSDLSPRLYADNFNSVTRDPGGGFVLSVENNAGSWANALIHCDENGTWSEIPTNPPMTDFVNSVPGDIYEFHSRPVAVAPSTALYIIGQHSIYRLTP